MTHYHKTGDNVSYRYLKAVGSMSASSMIDVVYYPNDMKRIVGFFERRNTTNGCANLDIAKLLKNRPGPKIHFLHFNSPNLFCDINHHDVFSQKFFSIWMEMEPQMQMESNTNRTSKSST